MEGSNPVDLGCVSHRRMSQVSTPAIVIAAFRYGETSKIVRLATRDHGVQSAIAKGALRPRSRFGAALQVLSEGTAHYLAKENRELHTLTSFDVGRVHVGLAEQLDRYAAATALAELQLRLAPAAPHPGSFAVLADALAVLEIAPDTAVEVLGLRALWRLVAVLGFAPALEQCSRDGAELAEGAVAFSISEGGALCRTCARMQPASELPADARLALSAFIDLDRELPLLDDRHTTAHRRLLARWVRHHLGEQAELPALEFWQRRSWAA